MWYQKAASPEAYEKIYLDKLKFKDELEGVAKKRETRRSGNGWIALIDMNSYFAVLEQQANPYLRGKPIGIAKEAGRSCVISASPEAKKLGIKTGSNVYEARKLCPNFITVPADFDKYMYNTRLLKKIFEELSPSIDIFSLDEAFIDLTHCKKLYPNIETFFAIAQQRVKEQLGSWVTFSLGMGENRLQAKLASEFAGKDHYFEITPENLSGCLMDAKVEDICGIGFALTAKLHMLNIFHPYQINFLDDAFLKDHFGIFWGPELRRIGQGKNSHLLDLVDAPPRHMKSVGRSKTLFKPTGDREELRKLFYNLAEDMCFKARRMNLAGQFVGLYMRDVDGGGHGDMFRLKCYVRHTTEVFGLLNRIFDKLEFGQQKMIKVGVYLGNLKPMDEIPLCWLPEWNQREKVFAAVDEVNQKYGLYTVKSTRLARFKILMPEVTGFLGDKTYQFGVNS